MKETSPWSGFHKKQIRERQDLVIDRTGLDSSLAGVLDSGGLDLAAADRMIENVIGLYSLPMGVATNFLVNGREVLVPMVVEEPSIVAGASFMAKLARTGGGFTADADESEMIGQIQVLGVPDPEAARTAVLARAAELLDAAGQVDPVLRKAGGGPRALEARVLDHPALGAFLVVHLILDVRDAMGANAVNTACERIAPMVETITGGRAHLRILSNLADRRLARARCAIPASALAFEEWTGERVRDGIVEAWAFAAADPYRAATHNKGILNGVDAVVIATGNDWRAVEAGAHAYAARSGRYTSLSAWGRNGNGDLVGSVELPVAVGLVGGATRVHPLAQAALRILGVAGARELAGIIAAVGLAQNLAALRALATEGIQRGHMGLHARQVAMAAGAQGELADRVAERMAAERVIRIDRAQELLVEFQSRNGSGAA